MAHSLSPSPAALAATLSTRSTKKKTTLLFSGCPTRCSSQQDEAEATTERSCALTVDRRRMLMWGLGNAILVGANEVTGKTDDASAAQKRLPPPPPVEKKDPNVSGVQAKVLASKKRKEAMKEAAAKLREKGKPINE